MRESRTFLDLEHPSRPLCCTQILSYTG